MLTLPPPPVPSSSSPLNLSVSGLKSYQSCPRKFYHTYHNSIEGKQPPDDKLRFGTAVHKVLELNANHPVAAWSVAEGVRGLELDLGALVAGTSSAYAAYWAGSFVYRATELRLETPLRNPRLRLVTILDGLAETQGGDLVVVDHKTTESDIRPGSWFWEKLQLDAQASAYLWAARQHGHDARHAVWDAIKRPNLKRRTEDVPPEYYTRAGKWGSVGDLKPGTGIPAESAGAFAKRVCDTMREDPTTYFQRGDIVRLDDELNAAIEDVEQLGEQVLHSFDKKQWPRNPNSCFAFGRRCEFWDICTGAAQPTDDQLYQLRRKR